MAEAARRLGWLGLIYFGVGLVGHFGGRAIMSDGPMRLTFQNADLPFVAAAVLGLALYVIWRFDLVSQKRLLELGLAFQVAGAFGFAANRLWTSPPAQMEPLFGFLPAECIFIVIYPLAVPSPPRTVLLASLLGASTGPATFVAAALVNGTAIDRRMLLFLCFSDYICGFVAYLISQVVHTFGVRLKHAREIGSYELVERIGEGGMGEVWQATHRLLAHPAAIKLIRQDVLGSNQRTRQAIMHRFEREARDTAALGSVHTVDVFDFGVTDEGDFYYVMELLDGISLERFVQTFGPMEPARVVYLLRQVAHSLGEAHTRGLLHRDIKPANIFMCRLGPDEDFVKVLDFGLVKHLESPGGSMLTMEGATAGTPAFMAPEIALGRPDVDCRADIYSLGCVAYYLLTGSPVFVAETPMATALAHINETPVPPSVRSEFDVPAALEALVLDCLAKDPAQRPSTAMSFEQRLAATTAADGWTSENVHAWWELNYAQLKGIGATSPAAEQSPPRRGLKRCWPRLERTPASQTSVAGR